MLLGHCTFVGLCCRGLLSIFHTVYGFVRENYLTPAPLWYECRQELEVFRGMMLFLESPWWWPWSPRVLQSDSSLEGYATSAANDYWVVTHYGVQRERYSPALQDEAKRKWMANRKRPRRFQDSDDDDE